ncbi:MAG: lamin tail domain-containing protein [Candidatus Woesearchaeota archaeon]
MKNRKKPFLSILNKLLLLIITLIFGIFILLLNGKITAASEEDNTPQHIEINEIMYNPQGEDNGKEWIEIYNPEKICLSSWIIGDLSSNDTLVPIKITNSSYVLIVEDNLSFENVDVSIYYAGPLIGNGLGNSGDAVFLYNPEKKLIDLVFYNNTFANGNNKTLEKFNNSWYESIIDSGTPGYENSVAEFFLENIYSNITSSSIGTEKNETTNNITNFSDTNSSSENITNQDLTTNENKTINITDEKNEENKDELCFAYVEINTTKFLYEDEPIKFRHIINYSSGDYSILYWVEDLFGNIIKKPYETKTLTQKSFTPHPKEKDNVYIIKSILKTQCTNISSEKIVIYKTTALEDESESQNKEYTNEHSLEDSTKKEENQKFSYELINFEENIYSGEEAKAILLIKNDNKPHIIKVSAYIYRGPKKYSEIYEESFTLTRNEDKTLEISLHNNASPGDYKLKIKINKDNQKTDYEITQNITILKVAQYNEEETNGDEDNEEKNNQVTNQKFLKEKELDNENNFQNNLYNTNNTTIPVVYKSPASTMFEIIPLLIIIFLSAFSIVLIWKR